MIKVILSLAITITICVFYAKGITAAFGPTPWTLPMNILGGMWIGWATGQAVREFGR